MKITHGHGRGFRRGHGHESESAWLAVDGIEHELDFAHGSSPGKQEPQFVFGNSRGEIADMKSRIHTNLPFSPRRDGP